MQATGQLSNHRSRLAECPKWHPEEEALYWTDISGGQLLRYTATNGIEVICEQITVGGFTIQEDGSLLLFMNEGTVGHYQDEELTQEVLCLPNIEVRFNDVVTDPEGRVLCGTMPGKDHPGHLYRLDTNGSFKQLLGRVQVPNGMGFSPDFERLYFTETNNQLIHLFDYNQDEGIIAARKTFADFGKSTGKPDGLTVDSDGNVWSALWGASSVTCLDPDGNQINQIEVSAQYVTSVTFGQPARDILYITTAQASEHSVDAGGRIFTAETGFTGTKQQYSAVNL